MTPSPKDHIFPKCEKCKKTKIKCNRWNILVCPTILTIEEIVLGNKYNSNIFYLLSAISEGISDKDLSMEIKDKIAEPIELSHCQDLIKEIKTCFHYGWPEEESNKILEDSFPLVDIDDMPPLVEDIQKDEPLEQPLFGDTNEYDEED